VSVTPEQSAQVLYLYHVDAVSLVIIAMMTGLSVCAVERVVHEARGKDLAEEKHRPRCIVYDNLPVSKLAVPQEPPPGRRHRRERRHDRT
jgi:hypothetical protein